MTTLLDKLQTIRQWAREESLPASPVQFFGLTAETAPAMRKGGRGGNAGGFWDRVTCIHSVSGVLGTSWHRLLDNALARQAEREGGTVAPSAERHARPWGVREEGTPIVSHVRKGEEATSYYVEVFPLRRGAFKWCVDDREATAEEIEAFLPYVNASDKGTDVACDDGSVRRVPLYCRDYGIGNVLELRMLGCTVSVEGGNVMLTHRDGARELVALLPDD